MSRLSNKERTLFREPKDVYAFIVLNKEGKPYIVYDNKKMAIKMSEELGFTWTQMMVLSK